MSMIVYVTCPHCCHHQSVLIDADEDDCDGSEDVTCVNCGAEYIADWNLRVSVTTRIPAPTPDPNQQALPL